MNRVASLLMMITACAGTMLSSGPVAMVLHIRLTDADGRMASLEFGTAPEATDGFDMSLGEVPIPPPPPPGTFEARFVDRPGVGRIPGDGSYIDIRRFWAHTQVDTFLIRVQTYEASPVRVSWGVVEKSFCDSMFIEVVSSNDVERRDMVTNADVTVPGGDPITLRIVKHGAGLY